MNCRVQVSCFRSTDWRSGILRCAELTSQGRRGSNSARIKEFAGMKKGLGRKITFRVFFKCQQGLLVSSKYAEVNAGYPR